MSLKDIIETSAVISFIKRRYNLLEAKIINIYSHSKTYRLLKQFWEKTKICFKNSFWGRITEIRQVPLRILDSSRTAQYLSNLYKRYRDGFRHYLKTSFIFGWTKDIELSFRLSVVRTLSVIILATIIVNLFLSLVIHKPIGLWGWLMRGLFLFAAIAGLFCKADWPSIKEGSVLLRKKS